MSIEYYECLRSDPKPAASYSLGTHSPFSRALERFFQSSALRGKYLDSRGVSHYSGYARPKFV
jgi:hypothetical protein